MDDFDSIVVGTEECPLANIVGTMKASNLFILLFGKWRDMAIDLEVNVKTIKRLKRNELQNVTQLNEVVHEILTEWVAEKGSEATLGTLKSTLVANGMKALSDLLEADKIKMGGEDVKDFKQLEAIPKAAVESDVVPATEVVLSALLETEKIKKSNKEVVTQIRSTMQQVLETCKDFKRIFELVSGDSEGEASESE